MNTNKLKKKQIGKETNIDFWIYHGNEIWQCTRRFFDGDIAYFPAWYFSDETSNFNGPFPTKERAERALQQHVENM